MSCGRCGGGSQRPPVVRPGSAPSVVRPTAGVAPSPAYGGSVQQSIMGLRYTPGNGNNNGQKR